MAERKQFINRPAPNEKLEVLLVSKKSVVVTEEELHAQRISFAFGNANNSEHITKASMTAAANTIKLFA